MKADIEKHKIKVAQAAESSIPHLMVSYKTGDLESLGKLCNAISVLAEFYEDNMESDTAKRVPKLTNYITDKFKNGICLILKNSTNYYGFTPNNIMKFIRGESVHGASEIRDNKRKTLHEYVFEKDNNIECEFQISWNWIAGPNLRSSDGNLDSGGPFVHAVKLNENREEVSLIESVILSIAYEFWQANVNGMPKESTKVFVKFNPEWYSEIWGNDLATKVKSHLENYHGLTIPETESD